MRKLPIDELLRLACIYAEEYQLEFLRCISNAGKDDSEVIKTKAFLQQIREYRMRRWGRTQLEAALEKMVPVDVSEIMRREDAADAR